MGGKEPLFPPRDRFDEMFPTVDYFVLEVLPVIEAGPPQVVVVELETERANEPQFRPHCHAGSADASRIVGDLRLEKHDMQAWSIGHGQGRICTGI